MFENVTKEKELLTCLRELGYVLSPPVFYIGPLCVCLTMAKGVHLSLAF